MLEFSRNSTALPLGQPAQNSQAATPHTWHGTMLFALRGVIFAQAGKRLVNGLDLTLETGAKHVLMGPNGAGKSLTLRLLQGLIEPTAGTVERPHGDAGRRAIVLQRPVMLRRSTAANLLHALKIYGIPASERTALCDEWLRIAGLSERAGAPARRLSGGEQQRLSLVRAMAARPALLLLDEPTAHLDPPSTAAIEALIELAASQGATILLVTHDAGQARRLAERVIFMDRGRITEQGPAETFFNRPQSAAAQAYLAGRLYPQR